MMFSLWRAKTTSPGWSSVGAFGEKFRKEREKKNFSLDDVSQVTKIGTRMLRAIEEERFDQLPGGVFNKGFIRSYAKHLGMNDEKAVADYLAPSARRRLMPTKPGSPPVPLKGKRRQRKPRPTKNPRTLQPEGTNSG